MKTEQKKDAVKIIPLGGLEQIGMNITAFAYKDSIIVVDCGLAFPEDDMFGIDFVIPDITFLKENIDKVKGFVITHGHEDHIGAIPYVERELPVPIYATKLTMAIIDHKLEETGFAQKIRRRVMKFGQSVLLGDFRVEFIKTNHSIQDAAALAIHCGAGTIVHTGDFKVDYTPVYGDAIDLQRFGELGRKGVLALMCDSTNAERPGFTMSEKTVGLTFERIFRENENKRLIIATFASNVDRVQQIINAADKYGRKVCLEGRSMLNVIGIAQSLGYIDAHGDTLIDPADLDRYAPEKTVLITTGSQGESMAALSRMAAGIHKRIHIQPGDVIVLSSTPIPGNEKAVSNIISELCDLGAQVIFQDTHVSGHACQEEIKLIYSLVQPKYAIPVHGERRHLRAHELLCRSLGMPKENIFLLHSGDVLSLSEDGARIEDEVPCGPVYVDGYGIGDVGSIVMRERQHLAADGILVVCATYDKASGCVLAGPDIISRGFVYVRESEELMDELRAEAAAILDACRDRKITDWARIKTEMRDGIGEYIWTKTHRRPMILPVLMEVEN